MTSDELEFAISQYLDGTLPAGEVAALQAVLAEDAAARNLLEEYRTLKAAIVASAAPVPAIAWDKLAAQISRAVDEEAEGLEYAISQYVDGTLPADEVGEIEELLAVDARARQMLDEHRRVTELVRASDMPALRWDRLATHLSDVVADAAEPAPIRLFARPWMRAATGLAMAACVTLVTMVGIKGYLRPASPITGRPEIVIGPSQVAEATPTRSPIVVEISGPERSAGTAVAEITIGAGPDDAGISAPAFAGDVFSRQPRSMIATSGPAVQDTPLALDTYGMPY